MLLGEDLVMVDGYHSRFFFVHVIDTNMNRHEYEMSLHTNSLTIDPPRFRQLPVALALAQHNRLDRPHVPEAPPLPQLQSCNDNRVHPLQTSSLRSQDRL